MIAPSLPAAAPAPAANAPAAHDAAAAGGSRLDESRPDKPRSEFAELLGPKAETAPAPEAKGGDAAQAESEDEDTGSPDSRPGTSLAERLLALIGASATPAQPAAPPPGNAPPASLTAAPPQPAAGALPHGALAAAVAPGGTATSTGAMPGLPLDPAVAAQGAGQAPAAAAAGTSSPAAAFVAMPATTAAPPQAPAATTVAAMGPMLADLAGAMAAGAREPARDAAGGRDALDIAGIGDRGPLLASGPAATTRPVTAPAAAGMLAMPTDPDAGFDDSFGARIGWMAEQRIGRAELRISPENMGTIDVRLQMDGTRVSAEFQSPHAEVRQALEQSVGRLRDMLGQSGLQLANANVGHGGGGNDGRPAAAENTGGAGVTDDGFVEMPAPATPVRSRGLLDEYA